MTALDAAPFDHHQSEHDIDVDGEDEMTRGDEILAFIRDENVRMRAELSTIQQGIAGVYGRLSALEARQDGIEKRAAEDRRRIEETERIQHEAARATYEQGGRIAVLAERSTNVAVEADERATRRALYGAAGKWGGAIAAGAGVGAALMKMLGGAG